ncbi:hypothetical protein ADM96_26290 [Burkholderia sp. ST111]|nr:hypothetical protein ADM96_26290 [Burkholderia sp. ST111]
MQGESPALSDLQSGQSSKSVAILFRFASAILVKIQIGGMSRDWAICQSIVATCLATSPSEESIGPFGARHINQGPASKLAPPSGSLQICTI